MSNFLGAIALCTGNGCGEDGRIPLRDSGDLVLVTSVALRGIGVAPSANRYLWIGLPNPPLFLGSRCYLYLDPSFAWLAAQAGSSNGSWSTSFATPFAPEIVGARVAMQAFAQPAGGGRLLDASNGLSWMLGL